MERSWDFPCGPVVTASLPKAGAAGSTPGWEDPTRLMAKKPKRKPEAILGQNQERLLKNGEVPRK